MHANILEAIAATPDRIPDLLRCRRHFDVRHAELLQCIDNCVDEHTERRRRPSFTPGTNPDTMTLVAVTPTRNDAQVPRATGWFRNPLPLSDGTIVELDGEPHDGDDVLDAGGALVGVFARPFPAVASALVRS